ncbi:MAG TPA: hypothetical protein VGD54_19625, partial [Steroidobacteraceae bacterium]
CQAVRRVTTKGSLDGSFWVTLLLGNYMTISLKSMISFGCLIAVVLGAAACSPRRIPPMAVADLMEDRVLLDGVLMKCNRDPATARSSSDCLNARIAIERLAARVDPAQEAKRAEEFERSRDQLRASAEKKRQEQQSKSKVDAYHLPVIQEQPVPPVPATKDPQSPTVSQTLP